MTSKQEHTVVQFRHFPFVYLRVEWEVLRNPSKTYRKCLLGASLPVVATLKILKRVYRCILYHITVMNDQNRKEEGRNGSTL